MRLNLLLCTVIILICAQLVTSKQKGLTKRALKKLKDSKAEYTDDLHENLRKRLVRSPQIDKDDPTVSGKDKDTSDEDFEAEMKKKPGANTNATEDPADLYLPPGYNRLEIPRGPGADDGDDDDDLKMNINVFLNVRYITEIDEANDEITMEVDLVLSWIDWAFLSVAYANLFTENDDTDYSKLSVIKTLDPSLLWKLWKPDIFIDNLVDIRQSKILAKPATLKLSPAGEMEYTARYTIKLHCELDFTYYPADTQHCNVLLRSYAYNSSKLILSWRRHDGVFLLDTNDDNFDVAVGNLRKYHLISTLAGKGNNETFVALQFTISARRRLSYQLLQTYIPSILYMGITWLCFMIPGRMIEARIAIAMTTLLTLTAMFGAVRESTPVVSYIKAIDIWMCASIAFVFLTLLEFSILLWTDTANEESKEKKDENASLHSSDNREPTKEIEVSIKSGNPSFGQKLRKCVLARFTTIITFVEDYSIVLVLLIFTIFCIIYWSWLLISSEYFEWSVNPTHNAVDDDDDSHADFIAIELATFS